MSRRGARPGNVRSRRPGIVDGKTWVDRGTSFAVTAIGGRVLLRFCYSDGTLDEHTFRPDAARELSDGLSAACDVAEHVDGIFGSGKA